jgi:hypothetical protein
MVDECSLLMVVVKLMDDSRMHNKMSGCYIILDNRFGNKHLIVKLWTNLMLLDEYWNQTWEDIDWTVNTTISGSHGSGGRDNSGSQDAVIVVGGSELVLVEI